jgi:hypothetical protein
MELVAVRDLVRDANFMAHGVDVLVTLVGEVPIETRGIWLTPFQDDPPSGSVFTRREPIRVLGLRRDEVPEVPKGAVILAPEKSGDTPEYWIVDGHDRQEAHHQRLIVRRLPDEP